MLYNRFNNHTLFFMFYNIYLRFRFANQNIYTTFAGVNSKDMKKTMLLLALCAMLVGCEDNISDNAISVSGNKYEKVYSEDEIWLLSFTTDSLKTYWCGALEVSASYIQKGSIVTCKSSNGNEFTIIAHKDYVIYSDKTFTKKR